LGDCDAVFGEVELVAEHGGVEVLGAVGLAEKGENVRLMYDGKGQV
jgi:hypothetical protein